MKIVSGMTIPEAPAANAVSEVARTESATPPATSPSGSASEALQSAVLQPALEAMRELPDIDQAKVATLRDALAKGELPFNAGKLAALIESFHRGSK
ncbi:MAG TPA: flagellar biosynthesis anti-sigma factor FlgM [Steroidobacteraceae bacterium]|jgi:negative regulator of flagellin synthesis FlgM